MLGYATCREGESQDSLQLFALLIIIGVTIMILLVYQVWKCSIMLYQLYKTVKKKYSNPKNRAHARVDASFSKNIFTMDVEFKDLSLVVTGNKKVLNGVNGKLVHGELTAVMVRLKIQLLVK